MAKRECYRGDFREDTSKAHRQIVRRGTIEKKRIRTMVNETRMELALDFTFLITCEIFVVSLIRKRRASRISQSVCFELRGS